MFEITWESAYLKHAASIPCFFRMGPLHQLNSLDLNAMTYVDVGLCMFVPLAGTGEVLIGFELLHSKFRADLPAIHMWPVPEDALPAIGIVTRQGPPKSKAQTMAIQTLIILCCFRKSLTQSGTSQSWRRQHFISPCTLSCLNHVEDSFAYFSWLYYTLKNHVGHTSYVPPEVWSQRLNLQRSYRGSIGQCSSGLVTVRL